MTQKTVDFLVTGTIRHRLGDRAGVLRHFAGGRGAADQGEDE
jgi:hypothetical protein